MFYRISQKIDIQEARWAAYIAWAGLGNCREFYSINDISLLTNWGGAKAGIQNLELNRSALVDDVEYAYGSKEMLHRDLPNDEHARACEVWAVYKIIWKNT